MAWKHASLRPDPLSRKQFLPQPPSTQLQGHPQHLPSDAQASQEQAHLETNGQN